MLGYRFVFIGLILVSLGCGVGRGKERSPDVPRDDPKSITTTEPSWWWMTLKCSREMLLWAPEAASITPIYGSLKPGRGINKFWDF